jgi:hypothetical protein
MNLAVRGIDADVRWNNEGSFHKDELKDMRFDYILANPPFNVSDWGGERLREDARWNYGAPPVGNANYAWLQHILWHLAPNGTAGVVLANGSMSSAQSGEDAIRRGMVEADVVDCMVALPGQLFYSTQIPACLWFLARNKNPGGKMRDRRGEVLFIDARKLGTLADRTRKEFSDDDIAKIATTYHTWREGKHYSDVPGFCKASTLGQIRVHSHVLTPGRYVGAEDVDDDDVPFMERFAALKAKLEQQFAQAEELTTTVKARLARVGVDMYEMRTVALETVLERLIDYRGKSPPKSTTGIPVISAKVVKNGRVLRPIEQTIEPGYYSVWMTRGLPQVGDVVMTTEGPLGEVAQLDQETAKFALAQRVICMRGKRGVLDNTFLKFLLMSPRQQKVLASYATGTTVGGISQKALRSVPISIPPYQAQVAAAGLLGALDDKIDLNRRMNETLEAMARAIFRDWFVDFGPTPRQDGRPRTLPRAGDLGVLSRSPG